MSRPYDLVIYGASGFTGAQVVESLTKYVKDEVKWAVAGRNEIKLRKVLADVSAKAGTDATFSIAALRRVPCALAAHLRTSRSIVPPPYRYSSPSNGGVSNLSPVNLRLISTGVVFNR